MRALTSPEWCPGIRGLVESGRHLLKLLDDRCGFWFDGRCTLHEGGESRRGLAEALDMSFNRRRGRRGQGWTPAQVLGNFLDERDGSGWAVEHHLGEDTVLSFGEPLAQPGVGDLLEDEVSLIAVRDAGAGVDVGFSRIRLDQALAETVNRGAGDFIKESAGLGKVVFLSGRKTVRQSNSEFRRDTAGDEMNNKLANAREQLACRQFGKSDGCNRPRRDAFGEHEGDAACHDGCLARTGAGFDEDRLVVEADRIAARAIIFQNFEVAHCSPPQS